MSYKKDSIIHQYIDQEKTRQSKIINLIASENYVSQDILDVTGSVLTNKYAEGYSKKRYYAGCSVIDNIETVAIERCKKLFNVEFVNVQPHSGSSANLAVYFALLRPGETILGMNLLAGGHLTHGWETNLSGSWFNAIGYDVCKDTELIDYDQVEELAFKHKPRLIIAGASAYSRIIDFVRFKKIAQSVNALFLADIAHIAGLIAADLHPSPVGIADIITSTTHKTLKGPRGGLIMTHNQEIAKQIDKAIIPGIQGGPLMHVIAAKAVAFHEALDPSFKEYQKQVIKNAQILAQSLESFGYRIVTGGTDNHLFTVDLRSKGITGKDAEKILESVDIIVNRNCIPFDPEKPFISSGIRLGTPAMTTRGMKEKEMKKIAFFINEILTHKNNQSYLDEIKNTVSLFLN